MTDVAVHAPPRRLARSGRYPGLVVAGQLSRRAGRSGVLWGLIFALYVVAQTFAYTSAYKTQASRDQLARAFGTNIGINALIGPARAINTVAGYSSWRALGVLSLLGAVWGLLTSTRLIRGDEEAGRYELLLAGQTTRRRAGGQALVGLGAGLGTLLALTADRNGAHWPRLVGRVQRRSVPLLLDHVGRRGRRVPGHRRARPASWPTPGAGPHQWRGSCSASPTPCAWWPTPTRVCTGWCGSARWAGSRSRGR